LAHRGGSWRVPRLVQQTVSRERCTKEFRTATILGGSGALGWLMAEVLAQRGAERITLVSRAARAVPEWLGYRAQIEVRTCDISSPAGLRAALADHGDLVVNAAGDAVMSHVSVSASAVGPCRSKTGSTMWAIPVFLKTGTRFVNFLSAACVLGEAGLAAYGGCHAAALQLTEHARVRGVHATSVLWGRTDIGINSPDRAQPLPQDFAVYQMQRDTVRRVMDALLPATNPCIMVVDADWVKLADQIGSVLPVLRTVTAEARQVVEHTASSSVEVDWTEEMLLKLVRDTAQQVVSSEGLTDDSPLMDAGLDSIEAVEFRTKLKAQMPSHVQLAATLMFDYPTVRAIASHLASELAPATEAAAQPVIQSLQPEDLTCITGMACRFPFANTIHDFWNVLRNTIDCVREIPYSRWDVDQFYDPDPDVMGKCYVRHAAMIDRPEDFDERFFKMSAVEARAVDPQQLVMLTVGYEALLDAGYARDKLMNMPVGVFIGAGNYDWDHPVIQQFIGRTAFNVTGWHPSIMANRISFALGLRGPSVTMDTACSSTLVGSDIANTMLRAGGCSVALAGGVKVMVFPDMMIGQCSARMLTNDGRCKTFDESANGYSHGEGCGAIVIKGLAAAEADGDTIHAVIRGSCLNQDGRTASLTAPNGPAQQEVVRGALSAAGLRACDLDGVETHGSGTALGDSQEVSALRAVLASGRPSTHPVILGAVKTNIGHLEGTAGIAGLIKGVLIAARRQFPGNVHLHRMNPYFDLEGFPVVFPDDTIPLSKSRALVGVSSFGFGGANSHMILETHSTTPLHLSPPKVSGIQPRPFPWRETAKELLSRMQPLLYSVSWINLGELQEDISSISAFTGVIAGHSARVDAIAGVLPALRVCSLPLQAEEAQRAAALGAGDTIVFVPQPGEQETEDADQSAAIPESMWELLAWAQVAARRRRRTNMVLVTVGAAVASVPGRLGVRSALMWGFLRSIRLEAPWIRVWLLDVPDELPSRATLSALAQQVSCGEEEAVVVNGCITVPRLLRAAVPVTPPLQSLELLSPHKMFLVTGGNGGVGLLIAQCLVLRGARNIGLVSRSGRIAKFEEPLMNELQTMRARIALLKCDVTDGQAVSRLFREHSPIGGVVHAAQAVHDYIDVLSHNQASFSAEAAVRASGAWNLHLAEDADNPMELFVVVSSLNALMGQGSNSALAAGNSFAEAVVRRRRLMGRSGSLIAISRILDVGSYAKSPLRYESAVNSIRSTPSLTIKKYFSSLLFPDGPVHMLCADVDWPLLAEQMGQTLSVLKDLSTREAESVAALDTSSPSAVVEWTQEAVHEEVQAIARAVTSSQLDDEQNLEEGGMDSLSAIDLRQQLRTKFPQLELSTAFSFEFPTVSAMVTELYQQLSKDRAPRDIAATQDDLAGKLDSAHMAASAGDQAESRIAAKLPGLFLHGAAADAQVMSRVIALTEWDKGPVSWTVVEGPHEAPASAEEFGQLASRDMYDLAGVYRGWRFPRSGELRRVYGDQDEDQQRFERGWKTSLDVIRARWQAGTADGKPFAALGGLCEGASAAALAILARVLQPPPQYFVSVGGYVSDVSGWVDFYQTPSDVPALHMLASDQEDLVHRLASAFRRCQVVDISSGHALPLCAGLVLESLEDLVSAKTTPQGPTVVDKAILRNVFSNSMRELGLMGVAEAGTGDHQFWSVPLADLGVRSLDLLMLRARVSQKVPDRRIPIEVFFEHPTLEAIASALESGDSQPLPPLPPAVVPAAPREVTIPKSVPSAHSVGQMCIISDEVVFEGPCQLGDMVILKGRCRIGAGCVIGDRVKLEGAALGAHCVVGDTALLVGTIVAGARCRFGVGVQAHGEVSFGADNVLEDGARIIGPARFGDRNEIGSQALIGAHSPHQGAVRSGPIEVGSDSVIETGVTVLHPRGIDGRPGVTRIGNSVHVLLKAEVSHDCVVEDHCSFKANLLGFCVLQQRAKLGEGAGVHQWSILGEDCFVAMGVAVRHDVLPFVAMDEHGCVLDQVTLSRSGRSEQEIAQLQNFYDTHFADGDAGARAALALDGCWFRTPLRRFLAAREARHSFRPLAPFSRMVHRSGI